MAGENRRLRRERGKLHGGGTYGLATIDSLHAAVKESGFYAHWSGYQARELLARQRFAELLDEEGMFRDLARRQMA